MAKTLLNGVNEVLKRANLIQGDSGALTTLTDSARQVWIDNIVQIWNEVMEQLYETAQKPMPQELAEGSLTLVTNTRAYALSTFNKLYFPLHDTTNGQYIYDGGDYLDLVTSQSVPADYTGLPLYAVIRPTDKQLYLDRIPTATENGLVYTYRYDKDLSVSAAADTFPFDDSVFRALVPAVKEVHMMNDKREFNDGMFKMSMARAAALLTGNVQRTSYGKSRGHSTEGVMFPFED
jgi:hypothetical protein